MRRVAITGMGAICALGRNITEFAESLRQGRPGIGPIESTDMSQLRFQNGAEVKGYTHQPYFEDRRADFIDRFAQFAVIAAREAVEDVLPLMPSVFLLKNWACILMRFIKELVVLRVLIWVTRAELASLSC